MLLAQACPTMIIITLVRMLMQVSGSVGCSYWLWKVQQLTKFLTFRSVHFTPPCLPDPPFQRSGSETRKGGESQVSLASQTHFCERGKGLVNSVYKVCPATLYSAVQSRCSILSHDTLHHLSNNSSLENSERELGHLSLYCRNCKNTSRIIFRERTYSATGNSRVHYLKPGYII